MRGREMKGNDLVMQRRERWSAESELEFCSVCDSDGYWLSWWYVCSCLEHLASTLNHVISTALPHPL